MAVGPASRAGPVSLGSRYLPVGPARRAGPVPLGSRHLHLAEDTDVATSPPDSPSTTSVRVNSPLAEVHAEAGLPVALADRLAEEMATAWRNGQYLPAEDWLAHHPELAVEPEGALHLIYEEVCLRQE